MQGYFAYMKHANTYKLRMKLGRQLEENFPTEISYIEVNRYLKCEKRGYVVLLRIPKS